MLNRLRVYRFAETQKDALVGMTTALANAVFHTTGKRERTLPIRIEDVLSA